MVRVLVMANDSLLADAIVSSLTQEATLDVLRLTQHDSSEIYEAIREGCSVVIIVEEEKTNDAFITASDLLRTDRCLRIITISSQKDHLHICEGYEMPVSGMTQVIDLAKGFNRDNWSGAIG